MKTLRLILSLLVAVIAHTTHALKADEFFKICHRSDPKLNDCIKETLNALRPTLIKGIPALKIQSVDPMVIPRLKVLQGSGPVAIDSTFSNTKVVGLSNFDVKSVSTDIDNYRLDIELALPWLYTAGDYVIKGKILVLPINGDGDSASNYTDVTVKASVLGKLVTRGGKQFMDLEKFKMDTNVKRASIHMNNLFNGNKQLGDTMNLFLQENWEVMFTELKPVVDEAVGALMKDVAQKVFSKFPFDELFPK